jgi:hypothetical protein
MTDMSAAAARIREKDEGGQKLQTNSTAQSTKNLRPSSSRERQEFD